MIGKEDGSQRQRIASSGMVYIGKQYGAKEDIKCAIPSPDEYERTVPFLSSA